MPGRPWGRGKPCPGLASLDRSHHQVCFTQHLKIQFCKQGLYQKFPLPFPPRNYMNSVWKTPSSCALPGPGAVNGATGKRARWSLLPAVGAVASPATGGESISGAPFPRPEAEPLPRSSRGTARTVPTLPSAAIPSPLPSTDHYYSDEAILFLSVLPFWTQVWNL